LEKSRSTGRITLKKIILSTIIASALATNTGEQYATALTVNSHNLVADELPQHNGKDLGPAPGDYVCMGLASCTAMTLRMYAERKQWMVNSITVKVTLVKAADMPSGKNTFYCEVKLTGQLTGEQEKRMMEIAKACPIHRLLTKPNDVVTVMSE
jgi:putative redox protein